MALNSSSIFDPDALPEALGQSDSEVLIGFYDMFLTHTRAGWRSVLQAAAKSQWENVAVSAHSLKSSCGSVGAFALSRKLEQLELAARARATTELIAIVEQVSEMVELTFAEISDHIISLESPA
jgi:HPt (histidine-containing phosphotransfer) domain-containing protein